MLRYKVSGMNCGHCVKKVTSAITAVVPDAKVEVDLKAGEVSVEGTEDSARVLTAIADAGYGVEPRAAA